MVIFRPQVLSYWNSKQQRRTTVSRYWRLCRITIANTPSGEAFVTMWFLFITFNFAYSLLLISREILSCFPPRLSGKCGRDLQEYIVHTYLQVKHPRADFRLLLWSIATGDKYWERKTPRPETSEITTSDLVDYRQRVKLRMSWDEHRRKVPGRGSDKAPRSDKPGCTKPEESQFLPFNKLTTYTLTLCETSFIVKGTYGTLRLFISYAFCQKKIIDPFSFLNVLIDQNPDASIRVRHEQEIFHQIVSIRHRATKHVEVGEDTINKWIERREINSENVGQQSRRNTGAGRGT